MAEKKYNPYKDVASVVNMKSRYNQGKATGDPNYRSYNEQAQEYYNNLIKNGMADVADELKSVDYDKAVDILKRYSPDTDTSDYEQYYSDLVGTAINNAQSPQMSTAVSDIMESYKNNDKLLNGDITYDSNGNVTGGLNIDHYNTGKNQLDYINNFDVTKQSYYEPIMSEYKLKGYDAAQGEYADVGSTNGGNIDSYAAANANRQQLAFTNAGMNAALAQANQNQGNWQTLYDSMTGHLSNMGTTNTNNLAVGANMYATDSEERQNALNNATTLANQEQLNRINQYTADLEAAMNTENNNTTLATTQANSDLQKYIAELEAITGRQTSADDLAAAQIAAQADMYAADRDLEGTKYKVDADSISSDVKSLLSELGYTVGSDGTVSSTASTSSGSTEEIVAQVIYNIADGKTIPGVESYDSLRNYLIRAGLPRSEVNEELEYWSSSEGKPYLFNLGKRQEMKNTGTQPRGYTSILDNNHN